MENKNYVCVIGGANIDISGTPFSSLKSFDSNPGKVSMTFGGVGRNIAENLSRLDVRVELITAFGNDKNSLSIKKDCIEKNIGVSCSKDSKNFSCSTYVCVNNKDGDVYVAISDMEILSEISPSHIQKNLDLINNSLCCIIDANIPVDTIKFIIENCKVNVFFDAVSTTKIKLCSDVINNVFAVKLNIFEAEVLYGKKILSSDEIKLAAKNILDRGIKNVFITMGENGLFFSNQTDSGFLPCIKGGVVNTTGAGDSFLSAVVWAYLKGFSVDLCAKAGMSASYVCVKSSDTVSHEMSQEKIKKLMESELL